MCDCIYPISDIKLHIYRKSLSGCISDTIFAIDSLTDVSNDSLNAVFYSGTSFSTFAFISRLCSEDDGIIILTYKPDVLCLAFLCSFFNSINISFASSSLLIS